MGNNTTFQKTKKQKQSDVKPLPKHVELYVGNNVCFNMFGMINLNLIRSMTRTKLSNSELKKRITKRFGLEITGEIEFK